MSRFLLCATVLTVLSGVSAAAPPGHAEIMPKAISNTLLDISALGTDLIVVGARGHILLSPDATHWTQKAAPARAMLNRVLTLSDGRLIAVGHDAVVLVSLDKGEHWTLQHQTISDQRASTLYDVAFMTPDWGYAIGTFGLMLVTKDGGKSWSPLDNNVTRAGLHLNAIAHLGTDGLIITGERGLVAVSLDRGVTWKLSAPPYVGSFFGVLPLSANSALVYGQRGHIYVIDDISRLQAGDPASFDPLTTASPDDAQALKLGFRRISSPVDASFFGGTRLADGRAVLVGSDAAIALIEADMRSASALKHSNAASTYSRVMSQGKNLLIVGMQGISTLPIPEAKR